MSTDTGRGPGDLSVRYGLMCFEHFGMRQTLEHLSHRTRASPKQEAAVMHREPVVGKTWIGFHELLC